MVGADARWRLDLDFGLFGGKIVDAPDLNFAFARGVPLVAVRLGKDPYGFIGKFQGLSSTWLTAAEDIVKILIKHDRMFSAYVQALRKCPSWDSGNTLGKAL